MPVAALTFIAVAGAAMGMFPGITSVIVLGSGSFLAVYAIVNYLEARAGATRRDRVVAGVATVLYAAALVDLVVELARDDRVAFGVLVGLVVVGSLVYGAIAQFKRRQAVLDERHAEQERTGEADELRRIHAEREARASREE